MRDREFDCALCGLEAGTLRVALVRWLDRRYDKVLRCTDVEGCRKRVADQGDVWPIIDPQEPTRSNGKYDPSQPKTNWKAERQAYARTAPPGMQDDGAPPKVDPVTGRVTWSKPKPIPGIAPIEPPRDEPW